MPPTVRADAPDDDTSTSGCRTARLVQLGSRDLTTSYLVERYWPGVTSELHAAAVRRGRLAAAELRGEGRVVTYVRSTLVPEQETVLCVFEADSPDVVRELNERADIPLDRITEAVPVAAEVQGAPDAAEIAAGAEGAKR